VPAILRAVVRFRVAMVNLLSRLIVVRRSPVLIAPASAAFTHSFQPWR
jgi:hypothetical protein